METILLVEDEPAVRQLFAQALTRAGYSVYEARNGQEAMKIFDQHGESIDLLLTDMRMPYMGGAELAHHLRGRRRTLKLLCISGYPGNLDADPVGLLMLEEDADRASYWIAANNFFVITRYNRSRLYAAAVWQLSRALRQAHDSER